MKQNKTKQNKTKEVLVIVRVSCWLLAMAAFCACSSDRLLGEGRRDQGRGRGRSDRYDLNQAVDAAWPALSLPHCMQ